MILGITSEETRSPALKSNPPAAGRLGADKAFLDHRGNKAAVMGEKEPARQTAGAAGVWAVLRVEKPIVGAKRPVKPQGMIEARDLEAGVEHRMTMRGEHGAKKSHVGEIREHRAMDGRIAGERSRRAQPDLLFE